MNAPRPRTIAILAALMSLDPPAPATAQAVTTPGALATVPVPPGFKGEYAARQDLVVLAKPEHSEVAVAIGPPLEAREVLRLLLAGAGAQDRAGQIEPIALGDLKGASFRAEEGGVRFWLLAVPRDGMVLVIRAQTMGTFVELEPALRTVARQSRFAPPEYPPLVIGRYQIGAHSSSVDSRGALYGQEYVTLRADGVVESETSIGGTVGSVSALGQGRRESGRWAVRGNRLLIWDGSEEYNNFLVKAFQNGLELYGEADKPLLAVRQ